MSKRVTNLDPKKVNSLAPNRVTSLYSKTLPFNPKMKMITSPKKVTNSTLYPKKGNKPYPLPHKRVKRALLFSVSNDLIVPP